jgi:hypothetical protein
VTVARAKRTARADARRRYRAEQTSAEGAVDDEPIEEPAPRRERAPVTAATPSEPGVRRGFMGAFRESFRPLDVRGDLEALPWIAIRTRALWLPILLTLASTAIFAAVRPINPATLFLFQYFVVTPAIGSVFIAGFMSPRASWLLGAIVGLLSAACSAFLEIAGYVPIPTNGVAPQPQDIVIAAVSISPVLGALFASLAAWYRRFLMLMNPNRGRPRSTGSGGRRTDGKSRTTGARQKAPSRR